MIFIFRIFFYFTLSFLMLSISYNGKPLFNHIHEISGPHVATLLKTTEQHAQNLYRELKVSSKKLYTNSAPINDEQEDSLSFGASSISEIEEITDEYTPEEKELLKKILREQGLK